MEQPLCESSPQHLSTADALLEPIVTDDRDDQRWLTRREAASLLRTSSAKLREMEAKEIIPRARLMEFPKKGTRGDFRHLWVYPLTQVALMKISGQFARDLDGDAYTYASSIKHATSSWALHPNKSVKLEASLLKDLVRRHHHRLNRREIEALSLYHGLTVDGEKSTYRQVAHQLGVSATRTRQLCLGGRRRLIRAEEELTAYRRELRVASSWGRLLGRAICSRERTDLRTKRGASTTPP